MLVLFDGGVVVVAVGADPVVGACDASDANGLFRFSLY